jgi:excisionase family DNA binding protein
MRLSPSSTEISGAAHAPAWFTTRAPFMNLSTNSTHAPVIPEYFVDDVEIGQMLGIHHRTVQQMARDGNLPAYPLGGGKRKTWRFLRSQIHEWMQARVNSSCHPCSSKKGKPN